uniref:Uncharacterized protein n=1 Tax=mine drainage metagenome TaxID=410659 RepID=E6Q0F2_9ZZZZ
MLVKPVSPSVACICGADFFSSVMIVLLAI